MYYLGSMLLPKRTRKNNFWLVYSILLVYILLDIIVFCLFLLDKCLFLLDKCTNYMMVCVCFSSGFQVNKSKPPLLTSYAFDS